MGNMSGFPKSGAQTPFFMTPPIRETNTAANETKFNEWLLAYHGEAKNTGCISP